MSPPRLDLLFRLAACALATLIARSALAAGPLKVLVLSGDADAALVERLHGQTSDLDVSMDLTPAENPAERPARVERALRLAEERGAAVAVWFEQPDPARDHLFVYVAELRTRRVMARELGEGGEGGGLASSTREAAALVVREALRAVMAGVEIGEEPAPALERAAAPSAAPPPPPPSANRSQHRATLRPTAVFGWGAAFDGEAPFGHQGPVARVGARRRSVETSLFVELALPSSLENRYGAVRLSRHVVGARGMVLLRLSPTFELGLGARAGVTGYLRTTEASPSVAPTGDRLTPSLLLGAETELAFAPRGSSWALVADGGLDVIPEVIRVGYEVGGSRDLVAEPAELQPRVLLGLRWTGK